MLIVLAFFLAVAVWSGSAVGQPRPLDAKELAAYQLTRGVFDRFARATRLILARTRGDARYERDPLFTKEITVFGDALESAAALQTRLETDPVLAGALFAADIDAREYSTFAITLFGARLAHGFMKSGALRRVPDGPTAHNVAFVAANEADVIALLREMGLER